MRFVYDVHGGKRKIQTPIQFPQLLDIRPYLNKDQEIEKQLPTAIELIEQSEKLQKEKLEFASLTKGQKRQLKKEKEKEFLSSMALQTDKSQKPEENPYLYELNSVWIHRGESASGGHYICHLKRDEYLIIFLFTLFFFNTLSIFSVWYELDDEVAKQLSTSVNGTTFIGQPEPTAWELETKKANRIEPKTGYFYLDFF